LCPRILARELYQIPAGTASDFEYFFPIRNWYPTEQLIASEQIVPPGPIIKIPLIAVHPIHAFECVIHVRTICERINGTRRKSKRDLREKAARIDPEGIQNWITSREGVIVRLEIPRLPSERQSAYPVLPSQRSNPKGGLLRQHPSNLGRQEKQDD
jgi:hypothetical protein